MTYFQFHFDGNDKQSLDAFFADFEKKKKKNYINRRIAAASPFPDSRHSYPANGEIFPPGFRY